MNGSTVCLSGKRTTTTLLQAACCALLVLPGLAAPAHGAGIFRVDASSTAATPNGQDWSTAYPTLQAATDAANTAGGGELWVKAGTYTSAAEWVLWLAGGVDVYGGFGGTETDRIQRDWKANTTIISGQNERLCVYCTNSATLDGFTLTLGRGKGLGGGMFGGTAVNCAFLGNRTISTFGAGGGGMCQGNAVNCVFMGNTAITTGELSDSHGGGMSGGTAINCIFTGNRAICSDGTSYGGGMDYASATNCTFIGNAATGGYGGRGGGMSTGVAVNCTFVGNTVSGSDISQGGGKFDGSAVNCTFTGNTVSGGGSGGGMCQGSATNCIFWGDFAAAGPELDSMISVAFSCIQGGYAGTGNIAVNPKLANAPDELWLLPGSPCLDAGTAAGAPADDLLGHARPQGAGVDMGAHESAALGVPHAPVVGSDASAANPPLWTWVSGGGGMGQYRFGFAEGVWEASDLAANSYTPPIPLAAGSYTLHVQERDAAGNWSDSGTHTLTVTDTAPPTGAIVINGNAATTTSAAVALTLSWDDGLNGSGVVRMRFSNDGINWSPWEKQASLKSWTLPAGLGYKTVRVQFLDRSGNRSAVCNDYIKVVAP